MKEELGRLQREFADFMEKRDFVERQSVRMVIEELREGSERLRRLVRKYADKKLIEEYD